MARRYYTRKRDIPKLKPGQRIDFHKGRGYFVTPKRPAKPIPVPPEHEPDRPASLFSGQGVFTTSDSTTALGYKCDWLAIQMDPEGDHDVEAGMAGEICWWMARPTENVLAIARHRLVPFIGQAENEAELQVCLALGRGGLNIPHALIGNPGAWSPEGAQEAVEQGWDLILEWYWTNTPSYTSPDADQYPLFRNVCFGTFPSETVPGRRVSVEEYRSVWKGPFSIWDTESATGLDRIAYNAP